MTGAADEADLSCVAVILPTWNSEQFFDRFSGPLMEQGIEPSQVLIVDSGSEDRTAERARSLGFRVHVIPHCEFNHGHSRALASTLVPWANILVYTTQDAIMASPDALAKLVAVFRDTDIGAAFGRQLPHAGADAFARHACAFNYPDQSMVRSFESRKLLGIRAAFLSNSFGAYRRSALEAVGNFPSKIIEGEDMYIAAKLMVHGWKTAYVSEATVRHSHNLTLLALFRRYFDAGVFHARESWIREQYGGPSGEGLRFVIAEVAYLWKENPLLIPKAMLRTFCKYVGFELGKREARLAPPIKRHLGNMRQYWVS